MNEEKKMAEKIQKCPMCGTKLKMINGRMTCKDCGYYLRDPNEYSGSAGTSQSSSYGSSSGTQQPGPYGSSSGAPQSGSYGSSSGAQQPGPYGSSSGTPQPGPYQAPPSSAAQSGQKASGSKKSVRAVLVSIASALCVALSSRAVRTGIRDIVQILTAKEDNTPSFKYSLSLPSVYTGAASGSKATPAPDAGTSTRFTLPKSDFAIAFIEAVYDKGYRTVTAEEYAAVTALDVDDDNDMVYYQLNHGETQYLRFSDNYHVDVSDLQCFPGLEQLYIEDEMLTPIDNLKGLENLYAVHTQNSAAEIAKYVAHPENIIDLGIYDWRWDIGLDGLEKFPNLLYLTVDADHLTDISALASYPDLLSLDLGECNNLTDYSPLMTLTQLEEFSISSSQLKTIDFVRQMPNLTRLYVEDSMVQSIDALSSCPNLFNLALVDNYKVKDYSVIGGLNNLTYLTLGISREAALPSFKNLAGVTYLSLNNVEDLTPLRDAVNVTTLILEECDSTHFDAITALRNLSLLKIEDFSRLTTSLAPLTQLPNLTELDISETKVFGNMEEIFSIPTLKYLYMDDCQVGIDFSAVSPNPNLEVLSMCDVRILRDPSYNNGDKIYLSEHYDFFDNFPNLTELYVSSANLDNIDFVTKMPGLRYLDISNNNITSLTPLLGLENFYTVWCGKNTILENIPKDSGIRVYTTSRD